MPSHHKIFYAFVALTALFMLMSLLYLGHDIVLRFNSTDAQPYVFSKHIIIIFIGIISYFIGYQLYDEKNKGDYTKWYLIAFILLAIDLWIIIINISS